MLEPEYSVTLDSDGFSTHFKSILWNKTKTYKWDDVEEIYIIQIPFFVLKIELYLHRKGKRKQKYVYVNDKWKGWEKFLEKLKENFPGFDSEAIEKAALADMEPFLCWKKT